MCEVGLTGQMLRSLALTFVEPMFPVFDRTETRYVVDDQGLTDQFPSRTPPSRHASRAFLSVVSHKFVRRFGDHTIPVMIHFEIVGEHRPQTFRLTTQENDLE